jgi:quercetin dioxygenase-like cupin family protein
MRRSGGSLAASAAAPFRVLLARSPPGGTAIAVPPFTHEGAGGEAVRPTASGQVDSNRSAVMTDTTVKKVSAAHSPKGEMGQKYLVSGKRVSLRLWDAEPAGGDKALSVREYETVGYVISGRADLHLAGQTVTLEPGDAWLVPPGAEHRYVIHEPFTAIEATAPPAQVHGRD